MVEDRNVMRSNDQGQLLKRSKGIGEGRMPGQIASCETKSPRKCWQMT